MTKSSMHTIIAPFVIAVVLGTAWSGDIDTIGQHIKPKDTISTLTKEANETGSELDPSQAQKDSKTNADWVHLFKESLLSGGSWIRPLPDLLTVLMTNKATKDSQRVIPVSNDFTTTDNTNVRGKAPPTYSTETVSELGLKKRVVFRFLRIGRSGGDLKNPNSFNQITVKPMPVKQISVNPMPVKQISVNPMPVKQISVNETIESKENKPEQLPDKLDSIKNENRTTMTKQTKPNKPTETQSNMASLHQKWMELARKRMVGVRIGKLPASLFLRRWNSRRNKVEAPSKAKIQRLLPRYG